MKAIIAPASIESNFTQRRKLVSRYLTILFCHDFLFEQEQIKNMPIFQANYLFDLIRQDPKIINSFISRMTKKELMRAVEIYENSIASFTLEMDPSKVNIPKEIVLCILILDFFYRSNLELPRIAKSDFVNEAVSNSLNLNVLATQYYNYKNTPNAVNPPFLILNYPWLFTTEAKVDVLQVENYCSQNTQVLNQLNQGLAAGNFNALFNMQNIHLAISVRRDRILEDSLSKLTNQGKNLKKPLKIAFVGEAGVDAGGVKKEFFGLLSKELFNPQFAMFTMKNVRLLATNQQDRYLWFNHLSLELKLNFELVGTLIGLAIYNSVLLELALPKVIYKKLLDEPVGLQV